MLLSILNMSFPMESLVTGVLEKNTTLSILLRDTGLWRLYGTMFMSDIDPWIEPGTSRTRGGLSTTGLSKRLQVLVVQSERKLSENLNVSKNNIY